MWHGWGGCFNLKNKGLIGSMRQVQTILNDMERSARDQLLIVIFRYRSHRIRYCINLDQVQNKGNDMVLCVGCSDPVELFVKGCFIWLNIRWVWKQTGQMPGREICWCLLTGLPVVAELENLCGWKWVDPICSLFFLLPTCPLVTTARGTTLLEVSPCSEAVMFFLVLYFISI